MMYGFLHTIDMKYLIANLLFLTFGFTAYKPKQFPNPNYFFHKDQYKPMPIDGYYLYENSNTKGFVTVFKNQNEIVTEYNFYDSDSVFACTFFKNLKENKNLSNSENSTGRYVIVADTLKAFLPMIYFTRGNIVRTYMTNFQGIVKPDRSIIENWRVVPPLPPALTEENKKRNLVLFTPKILRFVRSEAVKCSK